MPTAVEKLRRKKQYDRVFRCGSRIRGSHFLLATCKSLDEKHRVGFVVGREVGNAVRRNRARRVLREVFRHSISSYEIEPREFVFVARAEIRSANYSSIEREFRRRIETLLSRKRRSHDGEDPAVLETRL
jgi:ribonuclease P protein component